MLDKLDQAGRLIRHASYLESFLSMNAFSKTALSCRDQLTDPCRYLHMQQTRIPPPTRLDTH